VPLIAITLLFVSVRVWILRNHLLRTLFLMAREL
jgi:hypothetical protein